MQLTAAAGAAHAQIPVTNGVLVQQPDQGYRGAIRVEYGGLRTLNLDALRSAMFA